MRLNTGHIYVAPPDCHLLVETGIVRLGRGPKENRFRPAIDPLFRSAAQAYGPGAVGVILSGSLDDGSAGLGALKQLGGIAIVQAPRDALFPGMPANALRHVAADHVVPLRDMARVLADAVASDVTLNRSAAPEHVRVEVAADEMCEQITRGGPLAFVETPDAIDASRPPEILWELMTLSATPKGYARTTGVARGEMTPTRHGLRLMGTSYPNWRTNATGG